MTTQIIDWSVYVITDRAVAGERGLPEIVRAALQGGATVVQLRDKHASTRELIALGEQLHRITRMAGVPLIINDRVDVALAVGAEGVHLGVDDLPVALARRLLGPGRLVGMSPETVAGARQAERDGADYLGVGDVFGTRIKGDAGVPIGPEGLAVVARAVSIPVVAVGGITLQNAAETIVAGAAGVAVISAVIGASDPAAAARRLREIVRQARSREDNGQIDE